MSNIRKNPGGGIIKPNFQKKQETNAFTHAFGRVHHEWDVELFATMSGTAFRFIETQVQVSMKLFHRNLQGYKVWLTGVVKGVEITYLCAFFFLVATTATIITLIAT